MPLLASGEPYPDRFTDKLSSGTSIGSLAIRHTSIRRKHSAVDLRPGASADDVTFSFALQGFRCGAQQLGHPFFGDLVMAGLIAQLFGCIK
ncbi:hypothetical protein [Pseudomonas sp. TWRC1-2]|uniref:hypothetical protein n=1 Tax=Pseudomonas sp. TWRC1-2 TaxID=2804628 RepID=UPI003CED5FAC